MSTYQVTGDLRYRDHAPGERFDATLDPDAERRAIERGHITLIRRTSQRIRPGSYVLPAGWQSGKEHAHG